MQQAQISAVAAFRKRIPVPDFDPSLDFRTFRSSVSVLSAFTLPLNPVLAGSEKDSEKKERNFVFRIFVAFGV